MRELLVLDTDEDRAAVWQEVVESGEAITAKLVQAAVKRYRAAAAKDWPCSK